MIDLVKMTAVDENLSEREKRRIICERFLNELREMDASEIAPYMDDIVLDMVNSNVRVVFKFPIRDSIFQ